ncbi:hypothetical protein J3R82DRAFT_1868 [Butyriboletus roseoflavus]|nr:hypothetical protein J3R82DRAFT_1868 [Butyriboletus roseoflavus]
MLSSLIAYFGDAYQQVFSFNDGPPLHNTLTITYVSNPTLFQGRHLHVDVETRRNIPWEQPSWIHGVIKTYDDTWGANGKNCLVLESLKVEMFFNILLNCIN